MDFDKILKTLIEQNNYNSDNSSNKNSIDKTKKLKKNYHKLDNNVEKHKIENDSNNVYKNIKSCDKSDITYDIITAKKIKL